ncbi:hypothetical protein GCM10027259_52390 [Micromonospora palomenae]
MQARAVETACLSRTSLIGALTSNFTWSVGSMTEPGFRPAPSITYPQARTHLDDAISWYMALL